MIRFVALVALCAGCACTGPSAPDAATADAPADVPGVDAPRDVPAARDAPIPTDPGAACRGEFPTLDHLGECTSDDQALCEALASGRAGPDVIAHGTCYLLQEGRPGCWMQDDCYAEGPPDGGGETWYTCLCDLDTALRCGPGEVCVSDTPDGRRRCVESCAWVRDL